MSDVVFDRMLYDHMEAMAALRSDADRLRITEAERDAIAWAANTLCVGWDDLKPKDKARSRAAAATLESLLERIK
jgi:hypothetical protein